jgi:hypothetical protein
LLLFNLFILFFFKLWCGFWCSSIGITLVKERQLFLESLWWILHRFSAFNFTPYINETSHISFLQKLSNHGHNDENSFLNKIVASTLERDSKWEICVRNCPHNMAGIVMLMTISHARLISCCSIDSDSTSLDLIHVILLLLLYLYLYLHYYPLYYIVLYSGPWRDLKEVFLKLVP